MSNFRRIKRVHTSWWTFTALSYNDKSHTNWLNLCLRSHKHRCVNLETCEAAINYYRTTFEATTGRRLHNQQHVRFHFLHMRHVQSCPGTMQGLPSKMKRYQLLHDRNNNSWLSPNWRESLVGDVKRRWLTNVQWLTLTRRTTKYSLVVRGLVQPVHYPLSTAAYHYLLVTC